jgi:hypothetical protein
MATKTTCGSAWTWLGTGLGFCGAPLGALALMAATGNWHDLLTVGLPFLGFALGLVLLTFFAVRLACRRFGLRTPEVVATSVGCGLAALGLLLGALSDYVLPVIEAEPRQRELLAASGSVTEVPAFAVWVLLAAGFAVLTWPLWRSFKAPTRQSPFST